MRMGFSWDLLRRQMLFECYLGGSPRESIEWEDTKEYSRFCLSLLALSWEEC